ncbi:hypothetical protein TheveDRAFT_0759 [Thermanaerovibrio velox DSM 12556]|uniref:Uncharacterized protein n=2 Tax=Thermanaerovibrio TaxID=81461 RepID=H0URH0_9BACT|nr:hypothetical protein TheveDRAFT_0759 [Thermanaerovibrio velox DSM 12556]
MMYLWKSNKLGKIWLDGDGMRRIVSLQLPGGYVCQEVSFVGDMDTINVFIGFPEGESQEKLDRIGRLLESRFKRSGIKVSIHWVERTKEVECSSPPLWRTPIVWAAGVSTLVALAQLGFKGITKTVIAGCLSYGVAWLALTDDGRKLLNSVIKEVKKGR